MHNVKEAVGLRERKKRETRAALVDAAQALARNDGLEHLTVDAICARVGVSTRTFFNYFGSKVDAVLGIEPWRFDPPSVERFVAGGPTGRLADDAAALVAVALSSPALGHDRTCTAIDLAIDEPRLLARQVAWMEQHRAAVDEVVERRLTAHPAPVRADMVGVLILVLTRSSLLRWEQAGGTGSPAEHVEAVLEDLRTLL